MSLHPGRLSPIPEETVRVARAACRKMTVAMMLRDKMERLYAPEQFADLYPMRGRPAESPQRLALVSVLAIIEGLTDRQAAEAVATRLDWKYALGLALEESGFDFTILSDFRKRLLEGGAERRLFDLLLEWCRSEGWLEAGGTHRTDSTNVLGAMRSLNRLETAVETFRYALNVLAEAMPEWLEPRLRPEWVELYGKHVEESRLPQQPSKRKRYAAKLGQDGMQLLEAVDSEDSAEWLRFLPALLTFRRVWIEQFQYVGGRLGVRGKLVWREVHEQPPAPRRTVSPYDPEARAAAKGDKSWEGYKTHLTEKLNPEAPQLVVDVQTSPASRGDSDDLPQIHQRLSERGLLPKEHLVDGNYVSAELLIASREEHGVELIGPARSDTSAQGRAKKGFAASDFQINFQERYAVCPGGKRSQTFSERADRRYGVEKVFIRFSKTHCQSCPLKAHCTQAKQGARSLQLHSRAQYEALQEARRRQETPQFKADYDKRAGVEGTISQAARAFDLRRTRYRGLAKNTLRDVLIATAINIVRIHAFVGGAPRARTRTAPFVALALNGTLPLKRTTTRKQPAATERVA